MKSFDSLIGPETRAAMENARELHAIVSRTVPRDAAEHILFCRLTDDRLRLTLDHSAWVAKLRFNERQIVRVLAGEGFRVKQVSWHVAPPEQTGTRGTRRPPAAIPGPVAARRFAALANDFDDDDPLGRSIRRLARTLAGPGKETPRDGEDEP